jgi:hypothetical protein|tara:strand:+ start:8485 stop:9306 length:822 start_codon:yes stop_codon:yes gene_type:complete
MIDVVVYRSKGPWTFEWNDAFLTGLKAHGINAEDVPSNQIRPSDVAVVWAHKHPNLFALQKEHGGRYLVMERGYVGDRYRYTSLGFDGLNGHAIFPRANDGGERWASLFSQYLKPWCPVEDGYILLCGQVPGDASLGQMDHAAWLVRVKKNLQQKGYEVRFRPHPQAVFGRPVAECYGVDIGPGSGRPLEIDLCEARGVMAFNSNSTLDGVLAGIPAVVCDAGGMARPVAGHNLDDGFIQPDRTAWCHDLAFTQWAKAEIESGLAWENVSRCL